MGVMHISHFKCCSVPMQSTGSQCTETAFVRKLVQRIYLLHELRQLTAAEEILYGTRERLGINKIVRHHLVAERRYLDLDEQGEIRLREPAPMEYLGGLLTNYFESYFIFLNGAERILGSDECDEKEFFNQILRWGDGLYRKGDVSRRESRSSPVFRNALACMVSRHCIRRTKVKGGVMLRFEKGGREQCGVYKRTLAQLLSLGEPG